ncbi:MAG: Rpn family recombination-promoting nuclease/putative transposase [Treponema sp.]|nr:Rpn family recombination-promoting nuclease/putative transposase [Treponema sp.]
MTKLEYTFKTDILFKMMFVKNPDLLKLLVCELLGIKLESIGKFVITNPDMPPENLGDKFCKLDILMDINGQRVNLEIQVRNKGSFPERVLFNWAREYSSALPSGKNYSNLPRVINISLIHFNLFKCKEFHSEFQPLEINRHELLSDKMSFHFFELKKIPVNINTENMLLLWLALFKAETMEELRKIEDLEIPVMNQAIDAYYSITADSEFRERERLWEKARHDEATALYYAEQKGEKRERKKWKSVVAEQKAEIADNYVKIASKDTEIARLKAELEKRQ